MGKATDIENEIDKEEAKEQARQEQKKKQQDKPKLQDLEDYLTSIYEFRYNTVKSQTEIFDTATKSFEPLNKFRVNSLKREVYQITNKVFSTAQIKELLESDFSNQINPIIEYFNELSAFADNVDYIKQLASTIKVHNAAKWEHYLKKWLVACVANSTTLKGCQNHTCLTLTGAQGKFKTTWLDNLCPKPLKRYLFTGKIDLENKDSMTLVAENFLINIDDQLRQLNKKDENAIKNIITLPNVIYRRPYDIYFVEYPHLANFCASVNGVEFLTDPTGSRRFLPFEVLDINIDAALAIDINGVWAQAWELYKSEFIYWFAPNEVEELNKENEAFSVQSNEETLLLSFFKAAETRIHKNCQHLPTALILSKLQAKTSGMRLSEKRLGEALTKHKFERWQKGTARQWVWSIEELDFNKAIDAMKPEEHQEKHPFN